MSFVVWCAFVGASALMGLVPGPGVVSIVGYALGSGRRVALASVAGMAVGNALAMTLSLAGLGALLAASVLAFSIVKWGGALYLIGLGVWTLMRSRGAAEATGLVRLVTPRAAFAGNLALGTFHPKTIVFFVAFVPQFMDPAGSYAGQVAILIATFTIVVGATDTLYALIAAKAAHVLRRPRTALWSRRASGGVLIAAGVATAASRS